MTNLKFIEYIPMDIISYVIPTFFDCWTYLAYVGTCKDIRILIKNDKITSNHILDVVKIYDLIFIQKRNVFITGSAGCGKSYILNKIYDLAIKFKLQTVMSASTGISSLNLKEGRTLHSFSGLKKGTIPIDALIEQLQEKKFNPPKVWNTTDLLLVDEFSMIGSRFLSKLDIVGKHMRNPTKALGGIQLVLSGDFLQLPPVADKFAFDNKIWNELDITFVQLRFPFRQNQDLSYYYFLQRIRIGEPNEKDISFLEEKCKYTNNNIDKIEAMDIKPTRILSKQKEVKKINEDEFDKIKFDIEHTLNAEDYVVEKIIVDKKVTYIESRMNLSEAYLLLGNRAEHQAPSVISFKEGAQYILTFNFDLKKKQVNGSRCVYKDGKIMFMDNSIKELIKCMHIFMYPLGNNTYLRRKQVALRLGYAITIHGSQSLTIDCARLNLGKSIFCSAQAYVALSRIKNGDGLYIDEFVTKSIKTNKEAKKYLKQLNL
jgi:ATP-dependent DNA helicase PIF1